MQTSYLQAALTYQILDLLVWFKALLDDPNTAARKGWTYSPVPVSGASIAGKIERLTPSGGGIFQADADGAKASVPPNIMRAHSLTAGQSVQVVLQDILSVRSLTV